MRSQFGHSSPDRTAAIVVSIQPTTQLQGISIAFTSVQLNLGGHIKQKFAAIVLNTLALTKSNDIF